jgi:hypothetical protein
LHFPSPSQKRLTSPFSSVYAVMREMLHFSPMQFTSFEALLHSPGFDEKNFRIKTSCCESAGYASRETSTEIGTAIAF